MRFKIERYSINIIPETEEDVAYLEDTLGLKAKDQVIEAKRINAMGLSCIAYIQIKGNYNMQNTNNSQVERFVIELFGHLERLSEEAHNAWYQEKRNQGFHSPKLCDYYNGQKFTKSCDWCHSDMYPYHELPENIKEYDRVMVRTVLNLIKKVL